MGIEILAHESANGASRLKTCGGRSRRAGDVDVAQETRAAHAAELPLLSEATRGQRRHRQSGNCDPSHVILLLLDYPDAQRGGTATLADHQRNAIPWRRSSGDGGVDLVYPRNIARREAGI